jgi:hypothetical protein
MRPCSGLMKTYSQIRESVKTGGFWGWVVRWFTAESYSHIALVHWEDDGLWVSEMRGRPGHQAMPASTWVKLNGPFTWGMSPVIVRGDERIVKFVSKYRFEDPGYSYWALPLVWIAQWTGAPMGKVGNICSTYVQKAWEVCGYGFTKTPDPGDFRYHCSQLHYVRGLS